MVAGAWWSPRRVRHHPVPGHTDGHPSPEHEDVLAVVVPAELDRSRVVEDPVALDDEQQLGDARQVEVDAAVSQVDSMAGGPARRVPLCTRRLLRIGGAPGGVDPAPPTTAALSMPGIGLAVDTGPQPDSGWLDGVNESDRRGPSPNDGRCPTRRHGVTMHESTTDRRAEVTECSSVHGVPVDDVPIQHAHRPGPEPSSVRARLRSPSTERSGQLIDIDSLLQRFREVARRGRRGAGPLRPLLEERTGLDLGPARRARDPHAPTPSATPGCRSRSASTR